SAVASSVLAALDEPKDITSSNKDGLEDLEFKFDALTKSSELLQYYDGEESNFDEAIEKLAELEKKEEFIEPFKVDSTSLEEISQLAPEPGVESKPEEVLQQKPTSGENDVINESNNLTNMATGFGSIGFGEPLSLPSPTNSLTFGLSTSNAQKKDLGSTPFGLTISSSLNFGTAAPVPSVYRGEIPNAFNIGSIPLALSATPSNVINAFRFQSPAFGQPSFGVPGFGTPSHFPKPAALNAPSGGGLARYS
ncbi:1741_t:CDS:2, partial [Funneliformis mosseae]